MSQASDAKKINDQRFTEHSNPTAEEAGKVDGLSAGDDGFMEAMAKEYGFTYEKLDETPAQKSRKK